MHFSPAERAAYSKEYDEWSKRNPEHKERFVVYELPDRKGVYAIWDNDNKKYDSRSGFYEDENGNIETFTDKLKAEAYRDNLILNSDEKKVELETLLSAKTAFEQLKSGDMVYLDNALKPVQLVSIRQEEVLFVVPSLAVEITRTHEQVMEYLQKHKGNKHLLDAVEAELRTNNTVGTFEEVEKEYPPYEGILPDSAIGIIERNEYGYTYNGLLPLTPVRAFELFENGDTIYKLYENNAEGMVEDYAELLKFADKGGIFGIEVEDWERSSIYAELMAESANNDRLGDKFYVNKENQTVTWVYFNPDSEAGGQYVHNKFDLTLINEAIKENETAEGIFDYIGSVCKQELTDIDAEDFAEVDKSFKNDPYDFENCTSETIDALKSLAAEIQLVENELVNNDDYILPDKAIGLSERDLYGYTGTDMLPLLADRALELYDQDHTIYMLYEDNTEAMVFSREEISNHNGIFAVEAAECIASREYADMVKSLDSGEASKEATLIFGSEDAYALYQLKSRDVNSIYLNTPLDYLQRNGLSVERSNYALIYSAPLKDEDTPESIYFKFNLDIPDSFTGDSLYTSDVIVMQRSGIVTSYYVDKLDFKELPAFLGNEYKAEYVNEPVNSYVDLLYEHISNHADAGYLTEAEEKFLIDNIDTLDTKMLEISSLYENGMPLDTETDIIDRLFKEELAKSHDHEQTTPVKSNQSIHDNGTKKAKPSLLSQLEKNKVIVAQGKDAQNNTPKRESDKEV